MSILNKELTRKVNRTIEHELPEFVKAVEASAERNEKKPTILTIPVESLLSSTNLGPEIAVFMMLYATERGVSILIVPQDQRDEWHERSSQAWLENK